MVSQVDHKVRVDFHCQRLAIISLRMRANQHNWIVLMDSCSSTCHWSARSGEEESSMKLVWLTLQAHLGRGTSSLGVGSSRTKYLWPSPRSFGTSAHPYQGWRKHHRCRGAVRTRLCRGTYIPAPQKRNGTLHSHKNTSFSNSYHPLGPRQNPRDRWCTIRRGWHLKSK